MWIRSDKDGNITTIAPTESPLADATLIADSDIPADFESFSHSKYRFIGGVIVIRDAWSDPVVPETDTTDHEAIIAERLRKQGIRTE